MTKLGMFAVLYSGTSGGTDLPANEIGNVKDLTLNLETGSADITARDNKGWRAKLATLKECTVEWQMFKRVNDPGYALIRNAWLNNETIRLAVLTGPSDEVGSEGPVGEFTITNFSRDENLEEGIMNNVTAELSEFEQWYLNDGDEG